MPRRNMQSLRTALNRLNRITDTSGVGPRARITGTFLSGERLEDGSEFLSQTLLRVINRNVSELIKPILKGGIFDVGNDGFGRSNGQSMADIASAIARASRRYL